jgi:peptide/nickel transport system ATP-binding protein
MSAPLLIARDLARTFRVRRPGMVLGRAALLKAVDGMSFEIARGETLGLVGESGCGKSTAARLVLGLIPASSGTITFEGEPVTATRAESWRRMRRRMQMVYQDPLGALDRRIPAARQVREPLDIFGIGSAADREVRTANLLDAVGLAPSAASRYPHELSGGQRQRVVLARALVLEPSLLVCDEPVSALDVSIQAQVINLLIDLQDKLGLAMLFISHDLKVVRQVSHRVAVMYLGRIVEIGLPEQLLQEPAHPYTQALVSAVPNPRARNARRIVLPGDPPSPVDVPNGCSFNPRCPLAIDRCRSEQPALAAFGGGRLVACHRAGEGIASAALAMRGSA